MRAWVEYDVHVMDASLTHNTTLTSYSFAELESLYTDAFWIQWALVMSGLIEDVSAH